MSNVTVKKLKNEPEDMVDLSVVMRIYGGKKTYWNKAKDLLGLPFYNLAGIKFRLSEVEAWAQARKNVKKF